MRINDYSTSSGIKFGHAVLSGMSETLYVHECVAENAIVLALLGLFALHMCGWGKILLPVSDMTLPSKTFKTMKLWLKTQF
jgi:hypothetical protein